MIGSVIHSFLQLLYDHTVKHLDRHW